jgi:hypothetical protein
MLDDDNRKKSHISMKLLYWTVAETQQHHTYCGKTEITLVHKTAVCSQAADVQCQLSTTSVNKTVPSNIQFIAHSTKTQFTVP